MPTGNWENPHFTDSEQLKTKCFLKGYEKKRRGVYQLDSRFVNLENPGLSTTLP